MPTVEHWRIVKDREGVALPPYRAYREVRQAYKGYTPLDEPKIAGKKPQLINAENPVKGRRVA